MMIMVCTGWKINYFLFILFIKIPKQTYGRKKEAKIVIIINDKRKTVKNSCNNKSYLKVDAES
jgi:hypothetical protein